MSAFVYVCMCVYMCAQGQCVNLLNIHSKASQTFTIKSLWNFARKHVLKGTFYIKHKVEK